MIGRAGSGDGGLRLLQNIIEGGYTGPVYGITGGTELAGMISRSVLSEVP